MIADFRLKSKMKFFYEDLLKTIGEFGPWQMKMMFLLWVPMFMCGMEGKSTDFMVLGPKELYCKYQGCTSYMYFFTNKSITDKRKLDDYENIFPEIKNSYGDLDVLTTHPFCTIFIPHNDNGYCHWNQSTKTNKNFTCSVGRDEFEYPETFQFETLVTEFDLYCDFWIGRMYFSVASASGSFLSSIVSRQDW